MYALDNFGMRLKSSSPNAKHQNVDQVNNFFHYLTNCMPEIRPLFSEEGCRYRVPHNWIQSDPAV